MSSLGSDRFELVRQVGEGSSGVVYEARDLYTATTVAIKVLHRDNDTTKERFEREVAVLAELNHPSIVRYVAHGITEDKRRYLAMEWLEGVPASKFSRGPWSVSEVLEFARRIAAGLAYASGRGVVHRDIKPGNLLLVDGSPDRAKIVDFGLARFTTDRQRVTRTGAIVGTPAYMSPEQARGDREFDTRTDVFSFGSVLYRCLCGLEPFLARETLAVLAQICFEDPLPIEERTARVPRQLATLVEMMLRKDPRERPSWRAIADALADITEQYRSEDYDDTVVTQTGNALQPITTISPPTVRATALPRRARTSDNRILAALFIGATGTLPATLDLELHALITRFGARVERLIDGSRIVLPGQQLDASEQTQVAARCALSLRQLLSGRAPIVVCTGRAVIGDQQPLGKLFDRGAALLAKTSAGVVRVDEASASLLESRFELGAVQDGGQELERERSGGEAPRTVLGRHTPFVGRERELQQLQLVFSECCDELVARAVLVTAPPGGGKSRLRHELFERLRAARSDVILISGRGDAMRVGTQFGVLAVAIQGWAELAAGDTIEAKQNKLRARIADLLPSDRAVVATQFLAEMIGIPYPENLVTPQLRAARRDHQLMVDQLLACWLEWLEALDRDHPVLLCVEDLHWSDPASVRFIEVALRSSRERALMVLAFARPEIRETFPQLWAERDLIDIRLPKLGAKACARILDALRSLDVTPALQSAMIERADGNPFFLEELVRGYTPSANAELPDSILAILQTRLDTLGDEPKRLIQAASIFGQSFRLVGVQALLGEDDLTFDYSSALALLCDREIIFRNGPVSEQEYQFRHGLIRDAAYELSHEDDRLLGHRLAAEWLERNEDAPALLADHYERGGVPASAAIWWARAASQAFEAGSAADAQRFGERAIACGVEGEAYGTLAAVLAEVHSYREADEPATAWAQRARACVPVGSVDWWRATRLAAVSSARRGRPDLESLAAELASQFSLDAEMPEKVLAIAFTASECARTGRDEIAERMFALLPTELPESLSGRVEGAIETGRAIRAYRANNYSEALRFGERAVDAQRRGGATRDLCDMLGLCGYFALWLGAHSRIEAFMQEQLPLGERIGAERATSYGHMILGIVYLRQGRYDKAVSMLALAMTGYEKLNSISFQVETFAHLTLVHCATGELTRAHEAFERGSRLDLSDPASHAYLLASAANLARVEGHPAEALAQSKRARDLALEHGVQEFWGIVTVSYVESLLAVRDYATARTVLDEAEKWLEAGLARIDDPALRRCYLENIPEHRRIRELRAAHSSA